MDFNQVKYFLALADTLSFTQASERCHVSQSALTQAIKRLENELGGELISREGRQNKITELGKALRSHFEMVSQTRALIKATSKAVISGKIATLNIGIMCTLGPKSIASLLKSFQKTHPMISIALHDVTLDTFSQPILTGELDGVFCGYEEKRFEQINYIDLFDEEMVVTYPVGHKFSNMGEVKLIDVAKENYIDRLHCEFRERYMQFCHANNIEPRIIFSSDREEWIQTMVQDGSGVTVIPRYSLLYPDLPFCTIAEPKLTRTVALAVLKEAPPSASMDLLLAHVESFDWQNSV